MTKNRTVMLRTSHAGKVRLIAVPPGLAEKWGVGEYLLVSYDSEKDQLTISRADTPEATEETK